MLFTRRNPHHVTRTYLADRTSLGLNPADAGDDIERLPQRMGMPIRPRPRLEGHAVRGNPRRGFGRKLMILVIGGGVAMVASESLRSKVLDTLFGAEEEFQYTPPSSSASTPPATPVTAA